MCLNIFVYWQRIAHSSMPPLEFCFNLELGPFAHFTLICLALCSCLLLSLKHNYTCRACLCICMHTPPIIVCMHTYVHTCMLPVCVCILCSSYYWLFLMTPALPPIVVVAVRCNKQDDKCSAILSIYIHTYIK